MRRRRFRRTYAGKSRQGRRLFWYRQVPFYQTIREVSTGTFSDIIFQESDFQDPSLVTNDTRRGGPRLEYMYGSAGFAWVRNNGEVLPSGQGNFGMVVDSLICAQPDSLGLPGSSAAFDVRLESNKVLRYGTHDYAHREGTSATEVFRTMWKFESKVKRRLAESSIIMATRCSVDLASADILGYQAWAMVSLLVSTP